MKGRAPGEFTRRKGQHKARQHVFDACKRAKEGSAEEWVTVKDARKRILRVHLEPGAPGGRPVTYAYEFGFGAIIMVHGEPTFFELAGKDGMVYGPTGNMTYDRFCTQALAIVSKCEDVHDRLWEGP